jgi:hypothetical protein
MFSSLSMRISSLIAITLLACSSVAQATIWQRYSLKELVADHPLILMGEIVRGKQTFRSSEAIDIALSFGPLAPL